MLKYSFISLYGKHNIIFHKEIKIQKIKRKKTYNSLEKHDSKQKRMGKITYRYKTLSFFKSSKLKLFSFLQFTNPLYSLSCHSQILFQKLGSHICLSIGKIMFSERFFF